MKLPLLDRLLATGKVGSSAALATDLANGAQLFLNADGIAGELELPASALAEIRAALADDRSTTIELDGREIFVEVWNPPLRLLVVGAVHTSQTLAPLARLAGYDVTVIDPRTAFATSERFPETRLVHDWPDQALAALKPDRRTAVVMLTHDPKIDDPALVAALRSEAFYIGVLGSRRSHAKRIERLAEAGFDSDAIARVRGPVGLAIGALTPPEIAISIMAEITAVLRRVALGIRAR